MRQQNELCFVSEIYEEKEHLRFWRQRVSAFFQCGDLHIVKCKLIVIAMTRMLHTIKQSEVQSELKESCSSH